MALDSATKKAATIAIDSDNSAICRLLSACVYPNALRPLAPAATPAPAPSPTRTSFHFRRSSHRRSAPGSLALKGLAWSMDLIGKSHATTNERLTNISILIFYLIESKALRHMRLPPRERRSLSCTALRCHRAPSTTGGRSPARRPIASSSSSEWHFLPTGNARMVRDHGRARYSRYQPAVNGAWVSPGGSWARGSSSLAPSSVCSM